MEFSHHRGSFNSLFELSITIMSILELFNTLQGSSFARFIGGLSHLYCAFMELVHITGMLMLLSSLLLTSLNLLGLGLNTVPLKLLKDSSSRLFWGGLALLVVSGLFIFIPAASSYYPNYFFWIKLILIGLGLFTYLTLYRSVTNAHKPSKWLANITGVLVFGLWLGVAFAGRFIGFF